MYLKLDNKKTLIQIGYSKQGIADSRTEKKDEDGNDVIIFDFGSGNSCVECTDEDVLVRLGQLSDYVKSVAVTGDIYNIKWSDSKVSAVTGQDMEGEDITIQTHFSGDDSAKDARLLEDKWTNVRRDRDRRLSETDYLALKDNTLSAGMKTYRQELRDVPTQIDPDNISWPEKP